MDLGSAIQRPGRELRSAASLARRGLGVAWAIVALVLAMSGSGRAEQLDAIRARGFLACGIPPESAPGFSAREPSGRASGFDVDFCRALGAAIFGDPTKVELRVAEPRDAFTVLTTAAVDRKSTRLNSSHVSESRMPSSA